ncbi:MAG: hypothetical protein AAGA30_16250, partial [Planctomycetota bacterium]
LNESKACLSVVPCVPISFSFNHCQKTRDNLVRMSHHELVPAIQNADYERFATSIYEFNRLSGSYFSNFQDGCYRSSASHEVIQDLVDLGFEAVGQSSWGPCLFAVTQNEKVANTLVEELHKKSPDRYNNLATKIIITEACNSGATYNFSDSLS